MVLSQWFNISVSLEHFSCRRMDYEFVDGMQDCPTVHDTVLSFLRTLMRQELVRLVQKRYNSETRDFDNRPGEVLAILVILIHVYRDWLMRDDGNAVVFSNVLS